MSPGRKRPNPRDAGSRAPWRPRGRSGERSRTARLVLLSVAVAAGLTALGARCAWLQVYAAPRLLDVARSQQETTITLDPLRGPILDRNGKELAVSLDVDSVFAAPGEIADPAAAARRLAPLLAAPVSALRQRLEGGRHFAWLKRKVTPDLRRRVEGLDLRGVGFARESRRYYPKRTLAAHVIGACGVDNQGLAGIEFLHDTAIRGTPGSLLALRDGRGGRVLDRQRKEAVVGEGLELTLDATIQYIVERELDAVMRATSAEGATAVLLRPRTGEVLALASRPVFDPNRYAEAAETARRNRAVTDYYEPGSTFKVVTAAAAIDAGRVHPNEMIWCGNGSIVVAKHRFDEDSVPYGTLSFTEVLAKSSNVGAIQVARRLQAAEFLGYLRAFGFGARTGVDLPGESPGMLRDLPDWSGLSQASLSIGQEIGATTLQLAAMVGAIANDGVWVRPRLVQARLSPDGRRMHREARAGDERRAVAPATARSVRRMLESVITDGTAKTAAVPGYSVGGKTGTAQKIDATGRYARGRYVSWFAGFAPATAPALALVVMVDEPKGVRFHGGDVAAPVFARVALPVLQYLGVPADREGPMVFDRAVTASRSDDPRRFDPVARGGRPGAALAAMRRGDGASGIVAPDRGAPARVRRAALMTLPIGTDFAGRAGVPSGAGARRTASRNTGASGRAGGAPPPGAAAANLMPDLAGMSLRQATETLAARGLACRNRLGGQKVVAQQPEPGVAVASGAPCVLQF